MWQDPVFRGKISVEADRHRARNPNNYQPWRDTNPLYRDFLNHSFRTSNNARYNGQSIVDYIRSQAKLDSFSQEWIQEALTDQMAQQLSLMRQAAQEKANAAEDARNANKSASEAVTNAAEKKPKMPDSLENAVKLLNEHHLDQSEQMLLRLYKQMEENPQCLKKILIQVLANLAEICFRRSKRCRENPMERQWLCIHSIALLHSASDICSSELEARNLVSEEEWFRKELQNIHMKLRPIEDNQNRIFYNWLKNEERINEQLRPLFANTPTIQANFPLTPSMPHQNTFPGMPLLISGNESTSSKQNFSERLRWLAKFWHYCRNRLHNTNFNDILERLSEKADELDNGGCTNETDIMEEFGGENNSEKTDDVFYYEDGIRDVGDISQLSNVNSPVRKYSLAYELASSDVDVEGWDFFLEERKNFRIETVIQMSPRTKDDNSLNQIMIIDTQIDGGNDLDVELISPLQEHSISLTFVQSLIKLADRLLKEDEHIKAEALYQQIYMIVSEIKEGTSNLLRLKASTLKNLGMLKCKVGKGEVGLKMLKQGLQLCRDLGEDYIDADVSIALVELGNGYIVGKWNDESFFDKVIAVISESFEKEFSDPDETSSSQNSQTEKDYSKDSADFTHSEGSEDPELANIKEASACFEEAITILDEIPQKDKMQTDILAKAFLKLGDCHFMLKEFNEALECFEKAWTLFNSNCLTADRALFMENAHVLCMLGVSSFMLHVYPRTVSVFELAFRMVRHVYGLATQNFFIGLILSLLGITYYKLKYYHKCVSVCFQSFEIFSHLYGDGLSSLPKYKFWLVCQTLYVLGNSYNVLNLQHKAIKYLSFGRKLMVSAETADKRQFMRILQILGDCFFAQYDYKTSLEYYNEALKLADDKSNKKVFDPNKSGEDMALHNQLLSRSADAHISMRQYQNAVHYLEQARGIQDVLQEDIKGDLVSTLKQLGQMHSMSGDVDKAIESYTESIEIYKEIHGKLEPEMCETLGNLATMSYVKACICEEIDQELQMILAAEQHFQDALALEMNHCVCVKYANFLYSQGNYDDAILYLEDCLKIQNPFPNIVYGGLEKVTLPEVLQDEVDAQEEVVLPASSLAYYFLILCHKLTGHVNKAEKYIVMLMEEAYLFEYPLLYSLLGYALMECSVFHEAAYSFMKAASMQLEYFLAVDNYCMCLCIRVLQTLQRAFTNIWEHYGFKKEHFDYDLSSPTSYLRNHSTPQYYDLSVSDPELQEILAV